MPKIDRLTIYPIKSFDGHDLPACAVLGSGALADDRRYALVDSWGKYVNGKNSAAIHTIRADYSEDLKHVALSCEGQQQDFALAAEQDRLAAWCSEILGKKCRLTENTEGGFPDDCESPGLTLISTASLEAVASWYEGIDLAETRRRFRFNVELSEAPAFWEDGLVTAASKVSRFQLGDLFWQGRGVCVRCVVPTRSSADGGVTVNFASDFIRRREKSLPSWAPLERFDHFYRLGVNTRLDSDVDAGHNGSQLRVGDSIERVS